MENNENNVQNQVNENANKPQKSGKGLTIALLVIVLILVLAVGVCAGIVFSGKGDTIINKTQEIIKGEDKNKDDKTYNLSQDYVAHWSDKDDENSLWIKSIDGNTIKFDFGIFRTASLDDITATLVSDTEATFTTDKEKDGMVLEGKLKFENESVKLEITKSDNELVKAGFSQEYKYKNISKAVDNSNNTDNSNANSLFDIEDFAKKWETDPEDTEIQLLENGTFVTDHYTRASEIKGTYKIDNNVIELTTEQGKKWNGLMLIEYGEFVLSINMDGKEVKFYDMNHHTSLNKESIWYTCDAFKIKLPKSWENKYKVDIGDLGENDGGDSYNFWTVSDNEYLFSIEVRNTEIKDNVMPHKFLGNSFVGDDLKYVYMIDRTDAPANAEPYTSMMKNFEAYKDDVYVKCEFSSISGNGKKQIYAKNLYTLDGSMYRGMAYYISDEDRLSIIDYNNDITIDIIADQTKKLTCNSNENKIHAYPMGTNFMNNISREVEEIVFEEVN